MDDKQKYDRLCDILYELERIRFRTGVCALILALPFLAVLGLAVLALLGFVGSGLL